MAAISPLCYAAQRQSLRKYLLKKIVNISRGGGDPVTPFPKYGLDDICLSA